MRYTGLKELSDDDTRTALADACSHVWRQQHAGAHAQDRIEWREKYAVHGRCKCDKCERLWKKSRPTP